MRSDTPRQFVENSQVSIRVTLPCDWWPGRCRVALKIDGAPTAAHEFRIAE